MKIALLMLLAAAGLGLSVGMMAWVFQWLTTDPLAAITWGVCLFLAVLLGKILQFLVKIGRF